MTEIISQLEAERARIDQALAILNGNGANGVDLNLPTLPVKTRRKPLGAAIAHSMTRSRSLAGPAKAGATNAPPPRKTAEENGGGNAAKLRAVIANVSEPFDANECVALLGADGDPGKVRGCLAYWARIGQLKVVEAGVPGHPSKYERTAKFQSISGVKA